MRDVFLARTREKMREAAANESVFGAFFAKSGGLQSVFHLISPTCGCTDCEIGKRDVFEKAAAPFS
jgi:hypothetical protein